MVEYKRGLTEPGLRAPYVVLSPGSGQIAKGSQNFPGPLPSASLTPQESVLPFCKHHAPSLHHPCRSWALSAFTPATYPKQFGGTVSSAKSLECHDGLHWGIPSYLSFSFPIYAIYSSSMRGWAR